MARGLRLTGASWRIARRNPRLLVFPFLSGTLAVLAVAVVVTSSGHGLALIDGTHKVALFLWGLVLLFPLTLGYTFFGVAFASQADRALRGEPVSVRGGLAAAWRRRDVIAWWALVSATVGAVVRLVGQIPGGAWVAVLVERLLEGAWALISFFVVPLLALEDVGPREALRRSLSVFRARWGEQITGVVVTDVVGSAVTVAGAVIGVTGYLAYQAGAVVVGGAMLVAGVAIAILGMLASSVVTQIFTLGLLRHATGQPLPAGFTARDLEESMRTRDTPLDRPDPGARARWRALRSGDGEWRDVLYPRPGHRDH